MSDVPLARAELIRLLKYARTVEEFRAGIPRVLDLMTREHPIRRAGPRARPVSREMIRRVREIAAARPELSMAEIAIEAGLGPSANGRVSEILNGLRE